MHDKRLRRAFLLSPGIILSPGAIVEFVAEGVENGEEYSENYGISGEAEQPFEAG